MMVQVYDLCSRVSMCLYMCTPRNPVPETRPSFSVMFLELQHPDFKLLTWTAEDEAAYTEQARNWELLWRLERNCTLTFRRPIHLLSHNLTKHTQSNTSNLSLKAGEELYTS